jgi:hypothetical protein
MNLRINLRQSLAAAALLSTAVFTVACSSATAGTPAAGGSVSSSSSPTSAPASSAPSTSSHSSTSSSSSASTEIDEPTVTVEAPELDATSAIWLQNSCTDIGTLFGSLFAIPTVDGTATDEEYRDAYVTYYGDLTDTLFVITDRMSALDAPTFDGGQDLHDGYLAYLNDLSSITLGAAVVIQAAPDRASVDAAIEQINAEIEQLGQSDYGLSDFQGEHLQALMVQVPACEGLLNTA